MTEPLATPGDRGPRTPQKLDEIIELRYEPIVDLSTRRPVGVRALVVDRSGGAANPSPSPWLHPMSRTRLHGSLHVDMHVLGAACTQLMRWSEAGFDVRLYVPLDAATLQHPDMVAQVEQQVRRHGVNSHRIELSLTPMTCVTDSRLAVANGLSLFDRLGTTLGLLGFGTGYSSLAYLTTLPLVRVEVDASLGSGSEAETGKVLKSVLALCRSLNIRSAVASVQSGEEARRLEEYGFEAARGPNFSLPMNADTTALWLARQGLRAIGF